MISRLFASKARVMGAVAGAGILAAGFYSVLGGGDDNRWPPLAIRAHLETVESGSGNVVPELEDAGERAEFVQKLVNGVTYVSYNRDMMDEALSVLFVMTDDSDPEVLKKVAEGIARVSSELNDAELNGEALLVLFTMKDDADAGVRVAVADGIWRVALNLDDRELKAEALRILITMKDDSDPEVLKQVARGITMGDPYEEGMPSVADRIAVLQEIAQDNPDNQDVLVSVIWAYEALAIGPRHWETIADADKCLEAVMPMFAGPDPVVRAVAIGAAGKIARLGVNVQSTYDSIVAMKDDEAGMVRSRAVSMADYMFGSRQELDANVMFDFFLEMKDDPDAGVRETVALNMRGVLRKQIDLAPRVMQGYEDMLEAELAREEPAEDVLVFLPGPAADTAQADPALAGRAWEIINRLQFHEFKQVRYMTAHAIEDMGYLGQEQANRAVDEALEMVGDTDYWTAAREALSAIGMLAHRDSMRADPGKVIEALREARTIIESKEWGEIDMREFGEGAVSKKEVMLESVDFWMENTQSIIDRQNAMEPGEPPQPAPSSP